MKAFWYPFRSTSQKMLCNSYTMARRDLPDIYARTLGPHIREIAPGHGISNIYHLGVLTKTYIGPFGSLYI